MPFSFWYGAISFLICFLLVFVGFGVVQYFMLPAQSAGAVPPISSDIPLEYFDPPRNMSAPHIPLIEREIVRGEVVPIVYPAPLRGTLLCNADPTPYHIYNSETVFFVAASYNTTGSITCSLDGTTLARVAVARGTFPRKRFRVPNKFISYPPETLARIRRERALVNDLQTRSSHPFSLSAFGTIPYTRITSVYGGQRIYQNGHISTHRGTDYGLAKGTPVYSIGDGTVVLARNLYFCGNAVVIDHGLDIFSHYCHLNDTAVAVGERVFANSAIGTAGDSGFAIGSHLHLAAVVNGHYVDVDHFLEILHAFRRERTPKGVGDG